MYLSVDFGFTARKVITWGNTLSCFVKVKFNSSYDPGILYFFEKGNPQITCAAIQGLIDLIKNMRSDTTTPDRASDAFFANVSRYIQFQKEKGGAMGDLYSSINV